MFIRTKKIHSGHYAYLVQNEWTKKGSRQKTKAYLGRIFHFGEVDHHCPQDFASTSEFLTKCFHSLLLKMGFSEEKGTYSKDDLYVDLRRHCVQRKNRPAVLAANQGFLCEHTLKEAYRLTHSAHVAQLQKAGTNLGLALANTLVAAGLLIDENAFIQLYGQIVPK
ncbi:MAG: hypothetical protein ACOCWQ_05785 [Nanoarchaeota archaeon]